MTTINPETPIGVSKIQAAMPKLAVGAKLTADIFGSTRYGLEVRLDRTAYLLKATIDLKEDDNITFNITNKLNNGQHNIQILEVNERPLKEAIQAKLALKPVTANTHDNPAIITKDYRIKIIVRLANIEGKVYGPPFAIDAAIASESETSKITQPVAAPALPQKLSSSSIGKLIPQPVVNLPISTPDNRNTGKIIEAPNIEHRNSSEILQPVSIEETTSLTFVQQLAEAKNPGTSPKTMMATVFERTIDDDRLLLMVDNGEVFKVEQSIDLPVGATLQLALASSNVPLADNQSVDVGNPIGQLIKLLEKIEQFGVIMTDPKQSRVASQLPTPDRHLASKLLQLMNFQQIPWTGELGLMARLQDDADLLKQDFLQSFLSDIGRATTDSLTDGWRGTALPLGSDPAQAIIIYFRECLSDPEAEGSGDEEESQLVQRAVFEITFRQLGRCQIDVLCQEQRFDLQVRSERKFDDQDQQTITDLFVSACEIGGFKGEICYRQGQFVEPAKKSTSNKIITT